MGYLHDLGEKLDKMLADRGLDTEARNEVLKFVKDELLRSYKNGLRDARAKRDRA